MKKKAPFFLFLFFLFSLSFSQTLIKGSVKDAVTFLAISNVIITIEQTQITTQTNALGVFVLSANIPLGGHILKISKKEYLTRRYPIVVDENRIVNILDMTLERDFSSSQDLFTITLTDDELDHDSSSADNISGLLSASLDVFQRTAAFEFSASFFKLRGLDSAHASILINGIEMNKINNGRPQWNNWGGLNDVVRNQELSFGLKPSVHNFGGVLGATNINVRASHAKPGSRITYSSSDRSYTNRLMATYASGLLKNNWAFTLGLGRRWGNEGFHEASLYDSNSFFVSVEKKISARHSVNLTGIYAPNKRGKSSPNTQEVYDLKGIRYNAYWGWQDGKKRNSRIKEVEEPVLMLNHFWDLSSGLSINTNIGYQFGKVSTSRLDNNGTNLVNGFPEGGGANPSPTYYQKLPSYALSRFPDDTSIAYGAQQQFLYDGQINWSRLYQANLASATNGQNAIYMLFEDRTDDTLFTLNSILAYQLTKSMTLNASLNYKSLKSNNYAHVLDLLGAKTYLDVDRFATDPDEAQNNLLQPNRLVEKDDIFRYNYHLFARVLNGYAQVQFKYHKIDFYLAGNLSSTTYQREGLYQNGGFADHSLGKGDQLNFMGYGGKGGLIYKISGTHLIDINGAYCTRAPFLQNTYTNSRENHHSVPHITEEKIASADLSYIFRSQSIKAKITGYSTKIMDANEISFFFADGIGGDNTAFVQEILQGIDKKHLGIELGIEAQVTPTIKVKGVTSVGQFSYANNPNLILTTEADDASVAAGFINGFKDFGPSFLKGYKLAAGPHNAYSIGFEYRDPDFWWAGATANFLSNTYIDISPLLRSSNFNTDFDGNPFNDYNESLARELLKQEKFKEYMVVNLVGGKSWKFGSKYIGIFVSINNLLDEVYKTGGFENGRNANFRQLRDDVALSSPVFGSKYWYGRGITYFMNLSLRF